MIRLFAALPIPPDIAERLSPLMAGVPGAHWHTPDKLHLTLRFFGEIDERQADDLDAELAGVAGEGFDLALVGVGSFQRGGAPHHLWAGVEAPAALRDLNRRCERAARRAGLVADTRTFTPHVTLAYLDHTPPSVAAAWLAAHNLLRTAPFRARAFDLYSSWPARDGQSYRRERTYPLTSAA
ncbi:MAG: RNA 2',3'-cyclic phosphodiesterase [Alphaproteobacteria bacterium]|jgi:2'-5' RNA ligase|nr:RNA 2',3'-cyclic phosphodiesterase [Alphaproteobacteria bacterium]